MSDARTFPSDELSLVADCSIGTSAEPSAPHSELEGVVVGLFDQFRHPLLRYTRSMGVSVQDAEDVIQEVFMALFRHLQLRRSRESLRGWIFQVAHNLALKNRPVEDPDGVLSDQQADVALSPEEQLMMNEKRSCLLAVVGVLPELDRHCLRLRAEGLRYREIAGVLGISLGSVSVSLTRSLARLERAGGR